MRIHLVILQPSSGAHQKSKTQNPRGAAARRRRLATVHPASPIRSPEMATASLFSLPSLRALSRTSARCSRFQTLAARKPVESSSSTATSGSRRSGGKGGGLLSVLDRALADEEEYRRARAQVQRKGVEVEGYAVEGISVGGHETCVTVPSLNVAFDIGRGPQFAVSQDYLFITHAHLDHIVSATGPVFVFAGRGRNSAFTWFIYMCHC